MLFSTSLVLQVHTSLQFVFGMRGGCLCRQRRRRIGRWLAGRDRRRSSQRLARRRRLELATLARRRHLSDMGTLPLRLCLRH